MNSDPASLDRLHDIVVPPAVPWWPPAPAWYWVLGALTIFLLLALASFARYWQRNRYRREALALWRKECARLETDSERPGAIVRLAELLKRTALSAFPRDEVASLTGPAWFGFLDDRTSMANFSSDNGPLMENAAYDPRAAAAIDQAQARAIAGAVGHWIQHHTTR